MAKVGPLSLRLQYGQTALVLGQPVTVASGHCAQAISGLLAWQSFKPIEEA